jgi:hypothetical protein
MTTGRALALLAVFLLPAPAVRADVAGTGTFSIDLALTPPNVPFTGDISFDDVTQSVLGASVNLATGVGDMTFEGSAVVDINAESATFTLTSEADEGDFDFDAAGAGSCTSSGCVGGTGTFAGRFTRINDPDGVLPDGIYTFDGTAAIDFSGQGPGGSFAVNAFPRVTTPIGSDVMVSSGDETYFDTVRNVVRNFLATASFANVSGAGDTEFVAFSKLPGDFPAGIAFNAMVISDYVDIRTTATVTGGVRVCLFYPDANDDGIVDGTTTNISETRLRVLYATAIGQPFTDVTVSVADQQACGDVPTVGPVVLGVAAAGATTTTVNPTTTSTSVAPESSTTTSTTVPSGESTTTSTSSPEPTSTSTSTSVPAPVSTTTSTTQPTAASTTTSIVVSGTTSTSTPPPVCTTALECLDVAIAGPLCPGSSLNQKLATVILKKLAKAKTALLAARATTVAKKAAKQIAKAQKQLDKIGTKADAFVSKPRGAISPECRDLIRDATGLVTQQIQANRI